MKNEMTNEEAIQQINIIKSYTGFDKYNLMVIRLHEALDIAVEAIKFKAECEKKVGRSVNK